MDRIEEKVRASFARQQFMTTIRAEMVSVSRGKVELRLPFHEKLTQQHGYVHAAVITGILDSACGYAALSVAPEHVEVLSVEFKANFMAPAVGEAFVARAEVKRAGKKICVCAADAFAVREGKEKLIATMLGTIFNLDPA